MGSMSIGHWLIVLAIVLLLFGGNKLADAGKGLGEGIKNFKKGLRDDDEPAAKKPAETDPNRQLTGKKKKVIQVEVDEDADEEEVAAKVAKARKDKPRQDDEHEEA